MRSKSKQDKTIRIDTKLIKDLQLGHLVALKRPNLDQIEDKKERTHYVRCQSHENILS